MGEYYVDGQLFHHGVKGQKWGVRRYQNTDGSLTPAGKKRYSSREERKAKSAQKKEIRKQYRTSKADARARYENAKLKADIDYENAMSAKKKAMKDVTDEYNRNQSFIDTQYKSEIKSHQRKARDAKSYMDFYGEDSAFYKSHADRYEKHTKDAADAQSRYDAATYANKIARDNASIEVHKLYYDASNNATATREAAYTKAGEEYVRDIALAKVTYKEAKNSLKKS